MLKSKSELDNKQAQALEIKYKCDTRHKYGIAKHAPDNENGTFFAVADLQKVVRLYTKSGTGTTFSKQLFQAATNFGLPLSRTF